jgi:hypothetical protein
MKTMKKYQTGSAVKGSRGGKASQVIAGITGALTGIGAGITEARKRKKAKKAAEEKAKMEAEGKMKYGGVKKKMKKYQSLGEVISGPLNQNEQAMYDRTVAYKDKMPNVDLQKLRNTLVTEGLNENSSRKSTKGLMEARKLKKMSQEKMKKIKMKTGGMVNSNTKVTALKVAGSKGVKSGVNSKVSASKRAKGRTGGTSSAPTTATPKAKMGGMMRMKKK